MSENLSPECLEAQRLGYKDEHDRAQQEMMGIDKDPAHWNDEGKHISQMNREERRALKKRKP